MLSTTQIGNYKARWCKQNICQVVDLNDLEALRKDHLVKPSDVEEMFCDSYEFLSDGRLGHVFFSTPMLLSLVRKRGDVLHIDGTYRTTWANVIVLEIL